MRRARSLLRGSVLAERRPLVLARDRGDKLAPADLAKFDSAAAAYTARARGRRAPAAAVEALRAALTLPVAEGLRLERARFLELVAGEEAKAQRHVFFAEREAAKVPDIGNAKARDVARAAVIGAGTMGGGIAMCFANAGIPVTLVDATEAALARGLDTVERNYRSTVARGGLAQDEMDARLARITGTTDLAAIGEADIVIEAVFEDMAVKQQVFAELDRIAKTEAVLASNTSYLDIDALARGHVAAAGRGRHAFLQPGECHAPRRSGARRGDRTRDARNRDRGRPQARQDPGGGRRVPRLRRQPHAAGALGRGRAAAARGRAAAGYRRRAHRLRLSDGAVRHGRHGGARCRLAHAQGAGTCRADRRRAVRTRPLRPEDRPRLLSLRPRRAHAATGPGSRTPDRAKPPPSAA